MIRAAFMCIFLIPSAAAELLCIRFFGLAPSIAAPLIFYFTYVYGAKFGIPGAVLTGMLLDFGSGLREPVSALALTAVALLAVFWLRKVESGSMFALVLPGAFLPFIGQLPAKLVSGGLGGANLLDSFSDAFLSGLLCGAVFPFLILVLDFLGARLENGVWADAKERLVKEK